MSEKYDIIRIAPQDKPIYLVVPALQPDDLETTEYRYEEGSCPHDLLNRGCVAILYDGDDDPHGILEYVRTIDKPEVSRSRTLRF